MRHSFTNVKKNINIFIFVISDNLERSKQLLGKKLEFLILSEML